MVHVDRWIHSGLYRSIAAMGLTVQASPMSSPSPLLVSGLVPIGDGEENWISSFLEIDGGQSADIAVQFLQVTSWNLDEVVQLFFIGSKDRGVENSEAHGRDGVAVNENAVAEVGEDGVRALLPAKRDTLYGDPSFPHILLNDLRLLPSDHRLLPLAASQNSTEIRKPVVWESAQPSTSTTNGSNSSNNLASLYRSPYSLMYNGSFGKAKIDASL